MPVRNQYRNLVLPNFLIDRESVDLGHGVQIDWEALGALAEPITALVAGTVVSRVDSTSMLVVPRATAGAATAFGILVAGADKDLVSDSLSGYGVYRGGGFYENLLPDFDDAAWGTMKTELGARFYFERYQDTRGA